MDYKWRIDVYKVVDYAIPIADSTPATPVNVGQLENIGHGDEPLEEVSVNVDGDVDGTSLGCRYR